MPQRDITSRTAPADHSSDSAAEQLLLREDLTADCATYEARLREAEHSLGRLRSDSREFAGEQLTVVLLSFQQFAGERLSLLSGATRAAAPARPPGARPPHEEVPTAHGAPSPSADEWLPRSPYGPRQVPPHTVCLRDLPQFTGSPADLRHSATALGVAAWRVRQTADELPKRDQLLAAELHEATSEVRGALLAFAGTVQELLARLHHQRARAARLHPASLDLAVEVAPESAGPPPRSRQDTTEAHEVRRAVSWIIGAFQEAEQTAASRVHAACQPPGRTQD